MFKVNNKNNRWLSLNVSLVELARVLKILRKAFCEQRIQSL